MTENGTLWIVAHRRDPNSPGTPAAVAQLLKRLCALPGHERWADDISLVDGGRVKSEKLRTTTQVTDSYLLARAIAHGGRLATFDRRLVVDAVTNGTRGLHMIS